MPKLNQVKERYIYLSPTVQAGWEDESNINDFDGQKVLGKGAFGKVIRVLHRKSQLIYAVKEINKKNLKLNNMIEQVSNEVKIMYSLNHPYILKLYNHFEDDSNIYLVLEYAQGGQLYVMLWKQPNHQFEEKKVAKLCKALELCHSKGIIHRDIKPENILLDKDGNLKLADFGWSNFKQKEADIRTTFCGTLDYLAPEMLHKDHKHDFGVDIWSVGVLAYELLSGASPFAPKQNQNNAEYVEETTKQNIINVKFDYPKNFPIMAKDLISKILVADPKKRLPLKEIFAHPWIQTNCQSENIPLFEIIDQNKEVKKASIVDESGQKVQSAFTNEEIFKFSRPDSIINKDFDESFSKKENYQSNFKDLKNASFISNASSTSPVDLNKKIIEQLQSQLKKSQSDYQQVELDRTKKTKEIESLKQQLNYMNNSSQSNSDSKMLEKLKEKDEKYLKMKNEYNYIKDKFTEQEILIEKLQKSQAQSSASSNQTSNSSDEVERLKDENLFLKAQLDQFKTQLNQNKPGSDRKNPIEEMMNRMTELRDQYEKKKEELLKSQQEIIKLQGQKYGNNMQSSLTSNSSSQQMEDISSYLEQIKQQSLQQLKNEANKKK